MVKNTGIRQIPFLNILLIVSSLVVAFGLGEIILRLFYSDRLIVHDEERVLLYRYDSKLGWFPLENSTRPFKGSRMVTVTHNSRGFRDGDHFPDEQPGVLFLGDSFVWGYDVEAADRFTEKLRSLLPDWNVYNLGISGYSTDQELLLLMDQFDYYRPSIVVLVFCSYNDFVDNSFNSIGQGAYYKPYFDVSQNMALKGVPVPTSLSYFGQKHPWLSKSYVLRLLVRAVTPPLIVVDNPTAAIIQGMKAFVEQKGASLVVGLVEPHVDVENILRAEGIPYVQLYGAETYPENGWHWTPAGHTKVSTVVYDFLRKQGLLNPAKENRY